MNFTEMRLTLETLRSVFALAITDLCPTAESEPLERFIDGLLNSLIATTIDLELMDREKRS